MIEANQIKVDPHAAATIKGNQKMSWTKHKITFGRGSEWSADQSDYYRRLPLIDLHIF